MEAAGTNQNGELATKLAASINYELELESVLQLSEFLASWRRLLEEIEQIYHDGRVLQVRWLRHSLTNQAKAAWEVLQQAVDHHSNLDTLEPSAKKKVQKAKDALAKKNKLREAIFKESAQAEDLLEDITTDHGWEKSHKGHNFR